jgi:hypothetical protein
VKDLYNENNKLLRNKIEEDRYQKMKSYPMLMD